MNITCECCGRSAHFDAHTTKDPARFCCPYCLFEWGLTLQTGSTGKHKARMVVYHDPRQRQLLDLANDGDECAAADLFKEARL
jgi:hypothetical protein